MEKTGIGPWYLVLMINVALGVIGQFLMKQGVTRVGTFDPSAGIGFFIRAFTSPMVILGLGVYFVSAVLWIALLSRLPLSVAYPVLSLGYVLIVVFSAIYLHEPLSWSKLVGVLLISSGVFFITR
jgi:multidrug transporter EmrE-like cation transporter